MTTEASKSDSLTALLTQLAHDLEALPGKIAAEVAAQVVAALKPKAPLVRVGGKDLPVLSLSVIEADADDAFDGEASFTVESKHADLLHINSTVEVYLSGDPVAVFTGRLLFCRTKDNTISCLAGSGQRFYTADELLLWERKGSLQPLETLPFVEKMTQAD